MLTVSIIIPTRNESQDIRETINTCLRLDGPLKEIIVVDDSDDETPDIIREYADDKVRLIHRNINRNGCCGARSEGIRAARGDVCVLLNADARLNEDFLERILRHYEHGADFLVVESRVRNLECIWGSYIQARSYDYHDAHPNWSEGFSCRTAAAVNAKNFPGDYPVPFCRDYLLAMELRATGSNGHLDRSIIVEHVVPETISAFYDNYVYRGTHLVPTLFFIQRRSLAYTAARAILKAIYEIARLGTIVWPLLTSLRLRRHLKKEQLDDSVLRMFAAVLVTHYAMAVGNVKGLWRLCRYFMSMPKMLSNPGV